MSDPYSTLGVTYDTDIADIKKTYRKLCMKHHPDKGGNTRKFQEITEAYDLIKQHKEREQPKEAFTEYKFHSGSEFTNFFVNRERPNRFITIDLSLIHI